MPAIGDQHKPSGPGSTNPFEADKPIPSAYTAAEIATLQARLDKQLGPEYISSRPGAAGQKVHYLAADKVINLANEVFGFNGWSSSIQNIQIDFVDENAQTGKISLGLSVIVRVTLKDGTFHEDVGYGHIENCKGKAAAFEKCKKEGTTDAMKRTLRTFGNVLGNCIYDKEFVSRVTKVKVGAGRWDVNELHRHPDYVKKEFREEPKNEGKVSNVISETISSNEDFMGGFDITDFDEADFTFSDPLAHPDEVELPAHALPGRQGAVQADFNIQMRPPTTIGTTTPSKGPQILQQQHNSHDRPQLQQNATASREQQISHVNRNDRRSSSPGLPSPRFHAPQTTHPSPNSNSIPSEPAGFLSAKAANQPNSARDIRFNPHAESPSIRRTPGINHHVTTAVKTNAVKQPPLTGGRLPGPAIGGGGGRDFVDPRSNSGRQFGTAGRGASPYVSRSGAPGGASMGGMTTSAYRPPTRRKSPPPNDAALPPAGNLAAGVKRPPLNDVSNVHPANQSYQVITAIVGDETDSKRAKIVSSRGVSPVAGVAEDSSRI